MIASMTKIYIFGSPMGEFWELWLENFFSYPFHFWQEIFIAEINFHGTWDVLQSHGNALWIKMEIIKMITNVFLKDKHDIQ